MVAPFENCVLTIGKFEGVHLGHRALICEVVNRARELGVPSVVAAFDPHPFTLLRDPSYKPIFTLPERVKLIRALGIDHIVTFNFDHALAAMPAHDFCNKIAADLHPREIIVGENYRFGNSRGGSIETLRGIAEVNIFQQKTLGALPPTPHKPLKRLDPNFETEIISTSRVREFLEVGDFAQAEELLGFPFFVSGVVTKGKQLGRVLGFPTLNLYPDGDKFLPQNGVYETRTTINGVSMVGITNIGLRPTVSCPIETQISVETHIPSLIAAPNEMYDKHIQVEFTRFMRPECKFNSAEELSAQIKKDLGGLRPPIPLQGDKSP